jgi:prepilin-type N-terminal cleavage/methylation domain-containing protein
MRSPLSTSRPSAFTLIELLIVVAIIAILAAIAVPNFLEAQVRSKVSRTQSDMRSMATAIEAYRVDYNRYPLPVAIMTNGLSVVYPMPSPNHNLYDHNFLPAAITTPVAYLTTGIADVFANPGLTPNPEQQTVYYQSWEYTIVLAERAGVALMPPQTLRANTFGAWVMFACGPDRDRKDLSPAQVGSVLVNGIYDPTNGTVSNGDVVRTQRNTGGI